MQLPLIVLMVACAGLVPSGRFISPRASVSTRPINCQIWHNVSGAQITDTLATSDLLRSPDEIRSLAQMELMPGFIDGWACSVSGLVTAPMTGRYLFHIASRDSGLLYLSTDDTPANRRFIAETPAGTDLHFYRAYSAQTSDLIPLIAGHRYFIQAIAKNDPALTNQTGRGGLSIAWTLPGGQLQGPIPPDRFSPVVNDQPLPSLRVDHFSLSLDSEPGIAASTGVHKFVQGAHFDVNGHPIDMSYLMYFPQSFDTTTDTRPMLVFLHGNNCQGFNLNAPEQIGPMRHIEHNTKLHDWMPMIVMCPQLPPDWRWDTAGAAQAVNALVNQLCDRYPRIDRKRIYLTGLSMGGKGTWLTLENSPQIYAAVAPISAVDVRPDLAPDELKNLPNLHIACGSEDGGFTAGSHRMYEALKPILGDRVQLTVFPHEGHGVWDHFYASQSFYEELMKYSR